MTWRENIYVAEVLLLLGLVLVLVVCYVAGPARQTLGAYFLASIVWSFMILWRRRLQLRLLEARAQFATMPEVSLAWAQEMRELATSLVTDMLFRLLLLIGTGALFLSSVEAQQVPVFWAAVGTWALATLVWCAELSVALRYWWIGGRRRCGFCWFNPALDLESLPQPVTPRLLKRLPIVRGAELNLSQEDICVICLDALLEEEESDLRQLRCEHVFHASCVDPWLCKSDGQCPTCRQWMQ